jgi:hypothetical protein
VTVRAWFTISALVLAALAAAFVFRLFAPINAPGMLVRSGDVRLQGRLEESCWPARDGELQCEEGRSASSPASETVPAKGTFRIVVAYPAQPEDGEIRIDGPDPTRIRDWRNPLRYDLEPGTYTLTAQAQYPERAFVRYVFRFRVTRSGP